MRVLTALFFRCPERRAAACGAPGARQTGLEACWTAGLVPRLLRREFNVVAEENYIQDSSQSLPTVARVGGRGAPAVGGGDAPRAPSRSPLGLPVVSLTPRPWCRSATSFRWMASWSAIENSALRSCSTTASATMIQAEHIREEGAVRLGNMRSTLSNPVRRWASSSKATSRDSASPWEGQVWPRRRRPRAGSGIASRVRGEAGAISRHGRLWVDIATGRIEPSCRSSSPRCARPSPRRSRPRRNRGSRCRSKCAERYVRAATASTVCGGSAAST